MQLDLPPGVSPESAQRVVDMLTTHQEILRRVSAALAEQEEEVAPSVLNQLSRVEGLWRRIEARWGLLTAEEVTRITGGNPERARSHTANLRRRRGLRGVRRYGVLRYPGFQVDQAAGGIVDGWTRVVDVLEGAGWQAEEILLWAASPTGWLDGAVPAEVLDEDVERVFLAAREAAPVVGT